MQMENNQQQGNDFLKKTFSTLAMFGAFVGLLALGWFAYDERKKPVVESEIPVVKNDSSPTKIKPEEPGGMEIPNADRSIYDAISPDRGDTIDKGLAQLMPTPEEPVSKEEMDGESDAEEPTPAVEVKQEPAQQEEIQQVEDHHVVVAQQKEEVQEPVKQEVKKVIEFKKVEKAPVVKESSSSYRLQLGSFRTKDDIEKNWKIISNRFPSLLGKMNYSIEEVKISGKGVFYRLHAGPVATEQKARDICKELNDKKQGCLIAKPKK